jgi:capsular polysaccharide biosynthesis protein
VHGLEGHVVLSAEAQQNTAPDTQRYRRRSLDEIAASGAAMLDGRPRAEPQPWLAPETLDVPPFAFGATGSPRAEVADALRAEASCGRLHLPAVPAWVLRDALVHGQYGAVTIDGAVVSETLSHQPLHLMPGAGFEDEHHLRLPQRPRAGTLPTAFHLLAGNVGNFFHWLVDALARFSARHFAALGTVPQAPGGPVLLVPQLDVFWKWETLNALVPAEVPRIALAAEGMMFVQRLLYLPDLSGGGVLPHRALLDAFDAIAASVLGGDREVVARPWRRIYVARSDSGKRVLVNESEVIARAARAGFTPVVLSSLSVPEQVRLFAEASHILAPHGAGLTNLGFCRPGTAVCELHMDTYLHWAFRRLAALRGLRYGCLVGETVERGAWAHDNRWRIDPDAVDAVLRDPRFSGG